MRRELGVNGNRPVPDGRVHEGAWFRALVLIHAGGFERDAPLNQARLAGHRACACCGLPVLFSVDRAFCDAAQSGVADAFAAYVAPDGAQGGGNLVTWAFGPEAIRAAWAGVAPTFTWAPELGDVATSGDLGFTVGYVYSGGVAFSKYFTVWQKQPNGVWRYIVD